MKRKSAFALTVAALFLFSACAPSEGIIYNLQTIKNDAGVITKYYYDVAGYNGKPTDLLIPGVHDSLEVRNILRHAFYQNGTLEILKVGENVRTIGQEAFAYCRSLKKASLPDSMRWSTGNFAFSHCVSLSEINLGENLENIGKGAFDYCLALKTVTIGSKLTTIENYAFENCRAIETLTFPETLIDIGDYVFLNCSGITSIIIPKGVTHVGTGAFYGWTGNQTILFEEGLSTEGWSPDWLVGCSAVVPGIS